MKTSPFKANKLQTEVAKSHALSIIEAIAVGALAGFFAVLYRYLLGYASQWHTWLFSQIHLSFIAITIITVILMAWVTGYLLKRSPLSGGSGIPQVTGELLGQFNMPVLSLLLSKFVGGLFAIISGMSLGREGPSIQIGAAVAKGYSKKRQTSPEDTRLLITAGAAAGLAAAFNAPIAASLFVLEEIHKSIPSFILIPALISAILADLISKSLFGLQPSFALKTPESFPLKLYFALILLGIASAVIGYCFSKSLLALQTTMQKFFPKIIHRVMVGFLLAALVSYGFSWITGSGHELVFDFIAQPFSLKFLLVILFAKIFFTAFCYSTGVPGGIFLPTLAIGCLSGASVFMLIQLFLPIDSALLTNFMVLGMVGVLTAVVRSPLTSIILVVEMVGNLNNLLPLAIVAALAYIICERLGLAPIYESLYERMQDKAATKLTKKKISLTYQVSVLSQFNQLAVKDLAFPPSALLLNIERKGQSITPHGDTTLQALDTVKILLDEDDLAASKKYIHSMNKD